MGVAPGGKERERTLRRACAPVYMPPARRMLMRHWLVFEEKMARAKDKYGFAIGSRASQVAWLYGRPGEATNLDIMERFGGTRTKLLDKVHSRGFSWSQKPDRQHDSNGRLRETTCYIIHPKNVDGVYDALRGQAR